MEYFLTQDDKQTVSGVVLSTLNKKTQSVVFMATSPVTEEREGFAFGRNSGICIIGDDDEVEIAIAGAMLREPEFLKIVYRAMELACKNSEECSANYVKCLLQK